MEEPQHKISILEQTLSALQKENSQELKNLSDQLTHSATCLQDPGTITITVIIYSLGKIIERKSQLEIKNFEAFKKKISGLLNLSISAIKQDNQKAYEGHIKKTRQSLESMSSSVKANIKLILEKACINKAAKIHEHGVSSEQTANLLGITQWELSAYTGQKENHDKYHTPTIDTKKRIKVVMDFFS